MITNNQNTEKSSNKQNKAEKPSFKLKSKKVHKIIINIIGFAAAIITIYLFLKPEPQIQSHEIVKNKIDEIRSTFHPERIPDELDSMLCVKAYKFFLEDVLATCNTWVASEFSQPFEDMMNYNSTPYDDILLYKKRCDIMTNYSKSVIFCIAAMHEQAKADGYNNADIISINEFDKLNKLLEQKSNIIDKYIDRVKKYKKRHNNRKSIREIDKLRKDPDYLEFDIAFFNYCIDIKNNVEIMFSTNNIKL